MDLVTILLIIIAVLSIALIIAIVAGFMLIAPLVCWADSEGYGIFGAQGIEW